MKKLLLIVLLLAGHFSDAQLIGGGGRRIPGGGGGAAADLLLVHKAGAENITGVKSFNAAMNTNDVAPSTTLAYNIGNGSAFYNGVYSRRYYANSTAYIDGSNTGIISLIGSLKIGTVPIFEDNAAASTAGLTTGQIYRTSIGQIMIKY